MVLPETGKEAEVWRVVGFNVELEEMAFEMESSIGFSLPMGIPKAIGETRRRKMVRKMVLRNRQVITDHAGVGLFINMQFFIYIFKGC